MELIALIQHYVGRLHMYSVTIRLLTKELAPGTIFAGHALRVMVVGGLLVRIQRLVHAQKARLLPYKVRLRVAYCRAAQA